MIAPTKETCPRCGLFHEFPDNPVTCESTLRAVLQALLVLSSDRVATLRAAVNGAEAHVASVISPNSSEVVT